MNRISTKIMVIFMGLLCCFGGNLQAAPPEGSGYSWKLIFNDEFNGTSLDRSKWISQHPWTRDYKGDAYERDANVTVSDGKLTITAKAEEYSGHSFTSGAISTGYSKFRFKYGYAEARLKMPGARGSWSNFWMLTDGWPPEIDVIEYPLYSVSGDNNQRYRYITNIHYGDYQSNMGTHWKSNLSAGFHTYALDWRPWYIAYNFDDSYVRSLNDFEYSNNFGSMYLIFDYFVGGDWGGEVLQHPDPDTWPGPTDSSVQYQIDWVRVWQRNRDTNEELIGSWELNEPAGMIASDSSGNAMNGSLQGGMSFDANVAEGAFGNALFFDGVDDYVDLPDGFDEFDNGFTVVLWARPTAVKNWARFIDLGQGDYDDNIYLARYESTNDLVFRCFGGATGGGYVRAADAIELDQWQFFAATVDTSGNVVLYKNGGAIQTGTTTWPWGVLRTENFIGRSNWSSDAYYQGQMDEIKLYDYVLTAAEIESLYTLNGICSESFDRQFDMNHDCIIDAADLMGFAENWLSNGLYQSVW